jgi:hypothetical protein
MVFSMVGDIFIDNMKHMLISSTFIGAGYTCEYTSILNFFLKAAISIHNKSFVFFFNGFPAFTLTFNYFTRNL